MKKYLISVGLVALLTMGITSVAAAASIKASSFIDPTPVWKASKPLEISGITGDSKAFIPSQTEGSSDD